MGRLSRPDATAASRRRWRSVAVGAIVSIAAAMLGVAGGSVSPAAAAPGGPWTNPDGSVCTGQAFAVIETGGDRSIKRLDIVSGEVTETVPLDYAFNSLGFNEDDGYLYGTHIVGGGQPSPTPDVVVNGTIWRIGAEGAVEQVGVSGPDMVAPNGQNGNLGSLPDGSYRIGVFDEQGRYWVADKFFDDGNRGTSTIFGFEVTPGPDPDRVQMEQVARIDVDPRVDISDFSYIPGTNALWTVTDSVPGVSDPASRLLAIDLDSGSVTDYGAVDGLPAAQFVGTFVDGNGNMYALQGDADGTIWAINRSLAIGDDGTPTGEPLLARAISGVGSIQNGDAAQCGLIDVPVMRFSKVVDQSEAQVGDELTYTVRVDNISFFDLASVPVTDTLPEGAQFVSASDDGVHTDGEVAWTIAELPAGESVELTVTVVAAVADDNGVLLNRVLVENPDSVPPTIPPPTPTSETVCDDDPTQACAETVLPSPELTIEKASDATVDSRPGDTVSYTVTATNTSESDYTVDSPAVIIDDLSDVLDDATYNNDGAADQPGTVSYESPLLSWTGPLAAGETVNLTYTVALTSAGDGVVRNVAWQPSDPENPAVPTCDPPENGTDPDSGEPCAENEYLLPKLIVEKTADRTELPAIGEAVEYTITVTNVGPGAYTDGAPATMTDDLTDVLDSASYNDDAFASTGELSYEEPALSWSGALAAGESATITYTVSYTGEGDRRLRNLACVPESETALGAAPCDFVQIPGAGLTQWKQVQASSTPVVEGTVLTYTLFFSNDGEATATVATLDDLTHVTDDADVTTEPTSADGLTVAREGNYIAITGDVPSGETFSVTYQVTIKPDGQRGDDIAANFLLTSSQQPPTDPVCDPSDPDLPNCTVTPIGSLVTEKSVVADTDPVGTGTVLTYTLTFDNQGEVPMDVEHTDILEDVLDDADLTAPPVASDGMLAVSDVVDGRFTVAGELAAGETVTVVYEVTIRAEADRGNNSADNFLVPTGQEPPTDCVEGDPNCTSTPLPNVSIDKSADPASGTAVQAGQEVTYTLTFTNAGELEGSVDYSDDLSAVLDDAELTGTPVSSDPALVATSGEDGTVRVTGTLAPGQTVTVSYTVTVKVDGERGDNLLRNMVFATGTPDPTCGDDGVQCTEHPVGELEAWKTVDPASGTTVREGATLTYTLHFENTGRGPIEVDHEDNLVDVLDDADVTAAPTASDAALAITDIVDGSFHVSGTLEPGQSVTVSYQVTVKADGQRGDDRLANYLVITGTVPPTECIPTDDLRPDCTVNHVHDVSVTKSSDPTSGSAVSPGEDVTYTLTFTNTSLNPAAEATLIDYTDHMSDVLDDATLTAGPTTSHEDLSATIEADTLRIVGSVPSGESYTVSYTVTVKAYDAQGDHHIANVVAITGEEPVCAPESVLCTEHNVPAPPIQDDPSLPITGGTISAGVLLAALALLITGGVLMSAARRRNVVATLRTGSERDSGGRV